MSMFIVRVELHNAKAADYTKLATDLAALNIVDVIKGDNGTLYKLPPAEYYYSGDTNGNQLLNAIRTVVSRIVPRFSAVVTQANGIYWDGLEVVRYANRGLLA